MRTNINRITSLLLALVMTLSLAVTAFAADNSDIPENAVYVTLEDGTVVGYYDPATGEFVDLTAEPDQPTEPVEDAFVDEDLALVTKFSDVKSTAWYYNDVTECAKLGIVSGFEDGTFRPEDKVTYVQFGTMITRTFYSADVDKVQTDSRKPWYYRNMQVMRDKNLDANTNIVLQGGWPTINCGDKATNRYEMAMMLYNVMKNKGVTSSVTRNDLTAARKTIKDYETISSDGTRQYGVPILYCVAKGVITGMSDGTFSGKQNMTRAQACTVMVRMLKVINQYNPGDKDNDQYDDGTSQNPNTSNQNNNQNQQTGKLANGQDCTQANVLAILEEIKKEYPEGTVWDANGTNGNYYKENRGTDFGALSNYQQPLYGIGLQYACGGWACMVSERIFGKSGFTFREVTDPNNIRPGDLIVHYKKGSTTVSHVSIATSSTTRKNAYYQVTGCGGNVNGKVSWANQGLSITALGVGTGNTTIRDYRVFTRYPEIETEIESENP